MENSSPASAPGRLLTVGHSNHDEARLLGLLRRAGVTAVADVRSSPFSRRLPQYNRPQLEAFLRHHAIAYVFLGDLLGGRPADEDLYDEDGRGGLVVNYERVRATSAFRRGLDRLEQGLGRYTIALLCSEEDPLDCHRGLMIAPALKERGLPPGHLRKGGEVEGTEELEQRLLKETGVGEGLLGGLFPVSEEERRELLAEAYRVRNRSKAFRVRWGEPADRERSEGE
jgi:uncharacterized protein (DUF488 family)